LKFQRERAINEATKASSITVSRTANEVTGNVILYQDIDEFKT